MKQCRREREVKGKVNNVKKEYRGMGKEEMAGEKMPV